METIKTAVVVVLLLAVLYGVFVVLNKPDLTPPPELADWLDDAAAPLDVEFGEPSTADGSHLATPDRPAEQRGQPALALADDPTRTPLQPGAPKMPDAGEPEIAVPAFDQPPPADRPADQPAEPQLATAGHDAGPRPSPATVTAIPDVADAAPVAMEAAPDQTVAAPGSIYAQTANVATHDQADFRSIRAFDNAWNSATAQLQNGQWAEALLTLSFFFHDSEITSEERQRLLDLLDPLAGKVIYSDEHTMEAPYEVRPGDRLDVIAQQCQVPVALLQNINGIAHPHALQPGTRLKILRGPFRAEIDLKRSELILFLGKYYAGRFPVSVGNDPQPRPTETQVLAK